MKREMEKEKEKSEKKSDEERGEGCAHVCRACVPPHAHSVVHDPAAALAVAVGTLYATQREREREYSQTQQLESTHEGCRQRTRVLLF